MYLYSTMFSVRLILWNSDRIVWPTFPELNLTAEQIFQAGGLPT
ncbi:hypothetical protein [Nostoc sp.]